MKKPYLKKYGEISGFNIWVVDGFYIRKNIDFDFNNFGAHYMFNFIPEKEIWVDKGNGSEDEIPFYVIGLSTFIKEIARGKSRDEALKIADAIELKKRRESDFFKKFMRGVKTNKDKINRIHMQLLKKYSINGLKVWIVNGPLVRDLFYPDFIQGGNDKVYSFMPKNEIWIDNTSDLRDVKFILLHELHERNLICRGLGYGPDLLTEKNRNKNSPTSAHVYANKLENYFRHHPNKLDSAIKKELKITFNL